MYPADAAGYVSDVLSLSEGIIYDEESILPPLWQMVVYNRRKNQRNHLHLVPKVPKRKTNKYFRAIEPIVTEHNSVTVGSISFYRSFADDVKRSQRNLYGC